MKILLSLLIAGSVVLSACVPQNTALSVETLSAEAHPEQQVVQAGLATSLAPALTFETFANPENDRSFHADIAFYETALSYGPLADPRPIFLLANAYIVSNQQEYGIAFLERQLKRYEKVMTADMQATYLAAYTLLRATYADQVALPGRIWWVLDTFDLLEQAKGLSVSNPLVHWAAGLIYTQVPSIFGKKEAAFNELLWLVERPELEPTPGFYREAYRHLGKLYAEQGDIDQSEQYLKKSGYENYAPETLFMGWFATTKEKGLLFSPTPWIEEIVADRVFAVRGFGFSDIHFVVSDDGRELISIDAGTQPYSMKAAHEFLLQHYPDLPALTTAFITHAHWDHVGGYSYLRSLGNNLRIYGRDNYQGTISRVLRQHTYKQFRGAGFNDEWISSYKPDISIDKLTKISVGNTRIELVPVTGGETEDALLIYLPNLGTLFMGDALMPFYGEPWVEEGFIDEALETMDQALQRHPKHILHGHYGITVLYGAGEQLAAFRDAFQWLVEETRKHITNGYSAKNIIRLNLIPPGLENHPEAFLSYLAPRDHIIARTADHMVGIWQEDISGREPQGLDTLTAVEYGRLLEVYLDLSQGEIINALQRMLEGGDNELALQMAVAAELRYPDNEEIIRLTQNAADRLRSAAQYFDPFKFVTYTELIGKEHQSVPLKPVAHD